MKKSEIIKLTTFVLIIILLSSTGLVYSESFEEYGLIINDIFINKEITALTMEGITYIPLSAINDSLEIEISKEAGKLNISKMDLELVFKIQGQKAFLENDGVLGRNYAYIKGRTLYVPLVLLSDYLGFDVEVLKDIKCIKIASKAKVYSAGRTYSVGLNLEAAVKQPITEDIGKAPKIAYLTFDDGLDSKVTPQILDILKQYNVKATFFIIGNTINKNKQLLKRIVEEGHKVGNHTYTHKKSIIYTNVDSFSKELAKTSKLISEVTGITPKLFRPPYGAPYIRSKEYKEALSKYITVLWNVDSMDSRISGISSEEITAAVKNQVKNKRKATILFHSTSARGETVEALPYIIEYLLENGYTISSIE